MSLRLRALALLCATAASTGCMAPRAMSIAAPVADPSLAEGGTCNDVAARFLIGKTIDERLAETARVRAGARVVRVLRPGTVHDTEQRPSRLDLEVDDLGRAVVVRCG